MREKLTEVLVEPGTHAKLDLKVTKGRGQVIEEGVLTSTVTGKTYNIRNGIPRFVEMDTYAESFGRQWNAFREVQLDSHTGKSYSRDRFDAELGWTTDDLRGKWVLDAGCGAGRFAEIAAAREPNLVALDLSSAVDATARTLSRFSNVDVVQGSILEPPFKPAGFDYCYCIGVIQHTPDPSRAMSSLLRCVHKDGGFGFTIYARRPWTKLYGKYLLRRFTVGMPAEKLLSSIEKVMPVLFPVTEALFPLPVVGKLARFALPIANYTERVNLTRDQRYQEAILDTFDMLAPAYDSPMTWQEVESVLRAEQVTEWKFLNRVPINVYGKR